MSGGDTCRFEFTDHAIWTLGQPDLQGKLHIHDFHTPVDAYPKKGALHNEFVANHMEVASKVTGDVTVKGKSYKINGLAYRDHGWGKREWTGLVSHRWVAATFPNGMMVLMLIWHSPNDELVGLGCIVRDGKLTVAKDVDILCYIEPDGLTHRGGRATITLSTGERLVFDMEPFQKGLVRWIHGIACVDTFCRVTCGDMVGMGCLEMANNAQRGSFGPYLAINGIEKNGWHKLGGIDIHRIQITLDAS